LTNKKVISVKRNFNANC